MANEDLWDRLKRADLARQDDCERTRGKKRDVTDRVRDWVIGGAFAASILAGGAAYASKTAADEVARQQAEDRKDRQIQRKVTVELIKALDPEHAKAYQKILDQQGK